MQELLAAYPVIVTQDVAWGDMDSYHHVNNVVYFRYFENSRLAYFLALGWSVNTLPSGVGPILHSTQARYRLPLTYPDTIAIGARIVEIQRDRVLMRHAIASQSLGKIATEGESVIVTFDYTLGAKAVIPGEVRAKILEVEGRAGNHPVEPAATSPTG